MQVPASLLVPAPVAALHVLLEPSRKLLHYLSNTRLSHILAQLFLCLGKKQKQLPLTNPFSLAVAYWSPTGGGSCYFCPPPPHPCPLQMAGVNVYLTLYCSWSL